MYVNVLKITKLNGNLMVRLIAQVVIFKGIHGLNATLVVKDTATNA